MSKSLSLLVSGISWLSLYGKSPPLTIFSIVFSPLLGLASLYLLSSAILAIIQEKALTIAESFSKWLSLPLWYFLVLSVALALTNALQNVHDWRIATLICSTTIFLALVLIALFLIIIARWVHKDYNWRNIVAMLIAIVAAIVIGEFLYRITTVGFSTMCISPDNQSQTLPLVFSAICEKTTSLLSRLNWGLIAGLIAIGGLIYAIIDGNRQSRSLSRQAELLRAQIFGEVYNEAQIKNLRFYLPARVEHEVIGFRQREKRPTVLGRSIAIPAGSERELHIWCTSTANQTMVGTSAGFKGDYENKPQIIDAKSAYAKEVIDRLPRGEFIDWTGAIHTEYAHPRRILNKSIVTFQLRVKAKDHGSYPLWIAIKVSEAKAPFVDVLMVCCLDKPDEWARQHWTE